jgi:hypothetical protein
MSGTHLAHRRPSRSLSHVLAALLAGIVGAGAVAASAASLRFYGHGVSAPDLDRVKIPLQTNRPVNVGGGFTIEFWLKAAASDNLGTVTPGNDGWITGNIILDRDVYGDGDYGDWGIALGDGRIAFGVNNGTAGQTIVGTNLVADSAWHHIAVTRNATTGQLRLFVDGVLDAQGSGPLGDLSYRDGRASAWPNSDPFLVLGAEKHDAGAEYPSYNGWLDELRISTVIRYTHSFTPPTTLFTPDADTAALYHFDEGTGDVIGDAAFGDGSPGLRRFGGAGTPGPAWSEETPLVTPAPRLSITSTGAGEVTISWSSATATNWVLQQTATLSPTNWLNAPSGSTNPVVVPATAPAKFYRLLKP